MNRIALVVVFLLLLTTCLLSDAGADGMWVTPVAGIWTPVLEAGRVYTLAVYGTYIDGLEYDAEWFLKDGIWNENSEIGASFVEGDLLIDGKAVDWMGSVDGVKWTPHVFSPDHKYIVDYMGTGDSVFLSIDNTAINGFGILNSGSGGLHVDFVIPEPVSMLSMLSGLGGMTLYKKKR